MDVTQIPFAKHIGIEKKEENTLKLEPTQLVKNHMETIHASAQFTLAETQSGLFLQEAFPELVDEVAGVLRGATVKYKNPATTGIYAVAKVADDVKEKFLSQLGRRGRGSLVVHVEVKDCDDVLTMQGEFQWYVEFINFIEVKD